MMPFDDLQREHEHLLDQADAEAVKDYINRARVAAAQIGDPRERDQLRANLRYWASFVYDQTGLYPNTDLQPPAPGAATKSIEASAESGPVEAVHSPLRPWLMLIGGAVVVLIVIIALFVQLPRDTPAHDSPTPGKATSQGGGGAIAERLWSLPGATNLLDKPGDDAATQVLGQMQAGSQFYATARTTNSRWLKITTVDGISGWIAAQAAGLQADQLTRLPEAAIVIAPTASATTTPAMVTVAPLVPDFSTATPVPPTPTAPPTPTRAATPTPYPTSIPFRLTPQVPEPPQQAMPLQVSYQIVTFGPSPFNASAWVIDIQLVAVGGDNHYVFWVNGQRLDGDRYTIDGVACRAVTLTLGATSGGQAVRRDVTLPSPLATCK